MSLPSAVEVVKTRTVTSTYPLSMEQVDQVRATQPTATCTFSLSCLHLSLRKYFCYQCSWQSICKLQIILMLCAFFRVMVSFCMNMSYKEIITAKKYRYNLHFPFFFYSLIYVQISNYM